MIGLGDGEEGRGTADAAPQAVLLSGVYGSGKTSVAAEIADILEMQGIAYAALDLDWLSWFQAPGHEPHADQRMLIANLRAVIDNYLGAGVRRFILAHSVRDSTQLAEIRATMPAQLTVIRLVVSLDEIRRRLGSDVTAGRQDDLRVAEAWLAGSLGVGLEDFTVANDRPIRDVALDVLERLGWD